MQLLWRQAALIWRAKGYSLEKAADELAAKFGSNEGFSRSRVSTLAALERELCPPEVADFVRNEMKVINPQRWARFLTEMDAALEALAGPPITPRELREVAKDAASVVMDTVRGWLDTAGSTLEAFATRGSALLSGSASKLDSNGAKLDKLNAKLDSTGAKLDKVNAKLDSNGAKLDTLHKTANNTEALAEVISAKMDTDEQRRRREHLRVMGAILGVGLLLTCVSRSSAPAAPVQGVMVYVGQGAGDAAVRTMPGGVPVAFNFRTFLGAFEWSEMGKKAPEEQYIPDKPLPGQKLPPCDARLGEKDLKGGCWGGMIDVKPPCGLLFRYGDVCYRPIAADPSKGVGLVPDAPGQEQRQDQH